MSSEITVLLFTRLEDQPELVEAVNEGRAWLGLQAGHVPVPFDIRHRAYIGPFIGPPDTWWGQVWDFVRRGYPPGRYLCFVEGAGGVAGGNYIDGYGLAVVGDWCIRALVDGSLPPTINDETLPDWLINAGRNGQMGAWLHEIQHMYGGLHEDGGMMAEPWNWPVAGLPDRLKATELFTAELVAREDRTTDPEPVGPPPTSNMQDVHKTPEALPAPALPLCLRILQWLRR